MITGKYLTQAINKAVESVQNSGGPFGAVLVLPKPDGTVTVYTDNNHVTENNDPTAHAEVSVIRKASKEENTFSLEGATLYSSCEPCPMCLAASLWARVDKVYYAANRYDAAKAGFDDLAFYEKLEISSPTDFVEETRLPNATAPFDEWAKLETRIDY